MKSSEQKPHSGLTWIDPRGPRLTSSSQRPGCSQGRGGSWKGNRSGPCGTWRLRGRNVACSLAGRKWSRAWPRAQQFACGGGREKLSVLTAFRAVPTPLIDLNNFLFSINHSASVTVTWFLLFPNSQSSRRNTRLRFSLLAVLVYMTRFHCRNNVL